MALPRVVVLGATGFVAGALIRSFQGAAQACRAIGAREVDLTLPGSVAQLAAILQPTDSLVMCAALTPRKGRDRATFLKNIAMADHVCAALAESPCAHVVYISSDAVYADANQIDEQSCCETADLYGLAHVVREKMLAAVCHPAILRPCAVYGPTDTHNAYGPNRFVRSALASGKIALFGEGEEQRDHISIDDVVRIIHLCLQQRTTGILNAVTGRSLSFREIAETIVDLLRGGAAIESLPRQAPITHRCYDNRALVAAFPDFRATPLPAGIRAMIDTLSR
jgi:nucleoside-diphosphate-sugar epimerase